jgi:hypothetical protein
VHVYVYDLFLGNLEFESKRKAHYNEFKIAQQLRNQIDLDEDDDDEVKKEIINNSNNNKSQLRDTAQNDNDMHCE